MTGRKTMSARMLLAGTALVMLVAGCSQAPESGDDGAQAAPTETASASPTPAAASPAASASPAAPVLALEGLGDLVVGKPVPAGSRFTAGGAQASDTCVTYASPDYPGVYAIVEDGAVRRITVGQRSPVKLVEGIGVGSSEKAVLAAFPGFVASPHQYVGPPAKYLTQPGKDPRLMFEIGADGTVTDMHVGIMPQLQYVEGCA